MSQCFKNITIDIQLPERKSKCPAGDADCYTAQAREMLQTLQALEYLNPQVYDIKAKLDAIECYRQYLEQHGVHNIGAVYTPWGLVPHALSYVRPLHYNPAYVIRMKEKEYDKFDTLGKIADLFNFVVSRFGTIPHLFAAWVSIILELLKALQLPVAIAYRILENGIELAECSASNATLVINTDVASQAVPATRYICGATPGVVLDYIVVTVDDLIDGVVELAKKMHPDLEVPEPRATVAGILESAFSVMPRYIVNVLTYVFDYAAYIAGFAVEEPGGYVITADSIVKTDLVTAVKNALAAVVNLTASKVKPWNTIWLLVQ